MCRISLPEKIIAVSSGVVRTSNISGENSISMGTPKEHAGRSPGVGASVPFAAACERFSTSAAVFSNAIFTVRLVGGRSPLAHPLHHLIQRLHVPALRIRRDADDLPLTGPVGQVLKRACTLFEPAGLRRPLLLPRVAAEHH